MAKTRETKATYGLKKFAVNLKDEQVSAGEVISKKDLTIL